MPDRVDKARDAIDDLRDEEYTFDTMLDLEGMKMTQDVLSVLVSTS